MFAAIRHVSWVLNSLHQNAFAAGAQPRTQYGIFRAQEGI